MVGVVIAAALAAFFGGFLVFAQSIERDEARPPRPGVAAAIDDVIPEPPAQAPPP
jgi:hypothetical protein